MLPVAPIPNPDAAKRVHVAVTSRAPVDVTSKLARASRLRPCGDKGSRQEGGADFVSSQQKFILACQIYENVPQAYYLSLPNASARLNCYGAAIGKMILRSCASLFSLSLLYFFFLSPPLSVSLFKFCGLARVAFKRILIL